MARRLRIQFAGAFYHIVNRGNSGNVVFRDDGDCDLFLATLGQACAKTQWRVLAYCLLPDHFHLVIQTPEPNLIQGMKWLLGTYTRRYHLRHGTRGHLFAGRYRSQIIGNADERLRDVCDYVHLNPARARLIADTARLRSFQWSSLHVHLSDPKMGCDWLATPKFFAISGFDENSASARRQIEEHMEHIRRENRMENDDALRHAWVWGDEDFRQALLMRSAAKPGMHVHGPEIQEMAEAAAEMIVQDELKKLSWEEGDLESLPKGHEQKVFIAKRLRAETTMTLNWIADRLCMGTRTHLNHLLYWTGRNKPQIREPEIAPVPQVTEQIPEENYLSILLTDPTLDRSGFD